MRLPTHNISTRDLETRMAASKIHTSGRQFRGKYVGGEHVLHLKQTLEENYKVTTEWSGTMYIGITLDWDYRRRQVHLSLTGYTDKSLK